ncbi:hypothetical protein GGI43DRAFT_430359 [Trichoderma evansii]
MSIPPARLDTAPPRLRIPDITGPQNIGTLVRVKRGSPDRIDALFCLAMYRMQVTQLDQDQRREIIEIITKGRFIRSREAKKSPENHSLYHFIREKNFAAEYLTWPSYIILHVLYTGNLPPQYISEIEKKFGTAIIGNFSSQFFQHYPNEGKLLGVSANVLGGQQYQPFDVVIMAGMISDDRSRLIEKKVDNKRAGFDEAGAKDDNLPAPKRQKTSHAPETQKTLDTPTTAQQKPKATTVDQEAKDIQQDGLTCAKETHQIQNATTESSSVITPDVTSPVSLDVHDVRGRLLSKTSQRDSQSEDNAASKVESEYRLKALEESHRLLVSKFDTTTTALDAMNTAIEKIIMEAKADREGYNQVLGSIKEIMVGMADSIKDIKEMLIVQEDN